MPSMKPVIAGSAAMGAYEMTFAKTDKNADE